MKNILSLIFADKLFDSLDKSHEELIKLVSKNSKEYDSLEELIDAFNITQKNFFISQLNIINMLGSKEYNQLLSIDISTRNGLNHKTITEVGNYRINQVTDINNKNVLTRRYFILDFNNTITENGYEFTNEIYEIDINSFSILISEISSAKQNIEDNIDNEEALQYLSHMEVVLKRFIDKYHELKEFNLELNKM
ncbi:hypothetical protein UY456_15830 [Paenibacillus polymyxa]|uniref:hypothetical protein n=1 Tax=Paenibacillus polymyxa TaxID=1406 RepID=UPI002AB529AE|nr:hypothetical protein [Paenibacillus polymyxa]MDY8094468.1 hypothetical protein [Paenibacillus polymyxa]